METWYVMQDGSCADPREITEGAGGKLVHRDGRAVAYREDGETPRSRGVNPDEERAKARSESKARDMKPEEPKRSYKTRESKAD